MSALIERVKSTPRKPLAGLVVLYTLLLTGAVWPWGFLFLFIVVHDVRKGETWIVDYVRRSESPVLFWCTEFDWFAFGLAMLLPLYQSLSS